MRAAVLIYHKNAFKIYRKEWIDLCIESVMKQGFQDFDVFELEYSGANISLFNPGTPRHQFFSQPFDNFVQGMNFLLNKVFREADYECAFNVNLDDYYSLQRFSRQYQYIQLGYDIISSNWNYIDTEGRVIRKLHFSDCNIIRELRRGNNVIAHPAVCYSRRFWLGCGGYNDSQIPEEDLKLWQQTIGKFKFVILPDVLLYHRIHANKVTQSNNR